jgi:hypothetical protein
MKQKRTIGLIKGNGSPIIAIKPGRNEPCKCGSGKKTKHCCGASTRYFASLPDEIVAKRKEKEKAVSN